MEHFAVRLFAEGPERLDLGPAIPVFHRWIQQNAIPDHLLIDVADYRHVPDGPGVLLISHEAFISLNQAYGHYGLTYTRRTVLPGSDEDRLRQAVTTALAAARRIETEPGFVGILHFPGLEMEISVNDRLLAPNNDESFARVEPALRAVLEELWGPGNYQLARAGEPRQLLRIRAAGPAA